MKKWCELFIPSIDINRTNSPKFLNPDGYKRARCVYVWNLAAALPTCNNNPYRFVRFNNKKFGCRWRRLRTHSALISAVVVRANYALSTVNTYFIIITIIELMPLKCNYGLFMCALQFGSSASHRIACVRRGQKEFYINCIPFNKSTTNFDLCKLNYGVDGRAIRVVASGASQRLKQTDRTFVDNTTDRGLFDLQPNDEWHQLTLTCKYSINGTQFSLIILTQQLTTSRAENDRRGRWGETTITNWFKLANVRIKDFRCAKN